MQFLIRHIPGLEGPTQFDLYVFNYLHLSLQTNLRSNSHREASRLVWIFILSKMVPIQTAAWLANLFAYPGSEVFGFSSLHEAVLGIGARSVEQEIFRLASTSATINDGELGGRTPLLWAAVRGDIESTDLLLRYGAGKRHDSEIFPNPADS